MTSHFVRWFYPPGTTPDTRRLSQKLIAQTKYLTARRRDRFIIGRILLSELMYRIYGIDQLPELIINAQGRPSFADPDLPDFSIAYAGNIAGILLGEEGVRVGMDLELVRAYSRQTQHYLMQGITSEENAWINAQPDKTEAITQLWTLRQSILKLTGKRKNDTDSLHLHPTSGRLWAAGYNDIHTICDAEPMLIWSCALSPGSGQLRLWETYNASDWHELRQLDVTKSPSSPHTLRMISRPKE